MENDPKPYKFMKESIKKQPHNWKKLVLLIVGWLALAALGGLVAAAVFAAVEPKIADVITKEELSAKVDIPGDEDPNSGKEPEETVPSSTQSTEKDSSVSESETEGQRADSSISERTDKRETAEGTENSPSTGTTDDTEQTDETNSEEKDSSLENYEALYRDMLEVTEKPKRALVTVIGITISSRFPVL